MSFRSVPKSVTLNDLERRNGLTLRYFTEFGSFRGALRKTGWRRRRENSSRSLSHLLMSFCNTISACDERENGQKCHKTTSCSA